LVMLVGKTIGRTIGGKVHEVDMRMRSFNIQICYRSGI
jgi:hypothetical protein